jgi:hypothetical protein
MPPQHPLRRVVRAVAAGSRCGSGSQVKVSVSFVVMLICDAGLIGACKRDFEAAFADRLA